MQKIIKAFENGIISEQEAIEALVKLGMTAEEAKAAIE